MFKTKSQLNVTTYSDESSGQMVKVWDEEKWFPDARRACSKNPPINIELLIPQWVLCIWRHVHRTHFRTVWSCRVTAAVCSTPSFYSYLTTAARINLLIFLYRIRYLLPVFICRITFGQECSWRQEKVMITRSVQWSWTEEALWGEHSLRYRSKCSYRGPACNVAIARGGGGVIFIVETLKELKTARRRIRTVNQPSLTVNHVSKIITADVVALVCGTWWRTPTSLH